MKFKVSQKIFKKYPDLIEAVVILKNIDNTVDGRKILNLLRNEEKDKKQEFEGTNLSDHPKIKAWREAFKAFGSKPNKYLSSVEALLKRVVKGNELPDINPLVNLYNYCSIKHILPFGGEDFAGVNGDMELKYCTGDEEFVPILSKENEPPDRGEISWGDNKGITCRKWNWRQCDRTKVTENTKEGYFIIDGIPPSSKEEIQKAAEDLINLAKKHLKADGEIYWIDKDNPEVEVDIETKKANSKQPTAKQEVKKEKIKLKKPNYNNKPIPFKNFPKDFLVKNKIQEIVYKAIEKAGYGKILKKEEVEIMHPANEDFGDFSTNVAMILAGKLKKNPKEISKDLVDRIDQNDLIDQIDFVGGFINIKLKEEWLVDETNKILKEKDDYGKTKPEEDFRIIVEFGQPNTHKMPHIGHLFSFCMGESISRLVSNLGFKLFRANYQGDVGPHVAKCLWAYLKEKPETPKTYREKALLLQKMYQEGATAYKESETSKKEIDEINKKIYKQDPSILKVWKETREWSINFYKEFEEKLGVSYDRYYYESEAAPIGKKIVEENIGKVFTKSKGAIIFEGSKYGLHDRVFITKNNTPTYEAKDMALQPLKYKEWPFDFMVITTAHEQNEYFNVVFKALEVLDKKFIGKLSHLGFGMVNLKSGKMSSRLGNIITGIDLIEQGIEAVNEKIKDRKGLTEAERKKISEVVGIGAIKYSLLKSNPLQDTTFDFEESISFEGDSGPYLQYTYARARSILREADSPIAYRLSPVAKFNAAELSLLRTLYKFPEVVFEAGMNLSPNLLCSYLFDLAQKFNLFYKKHKVLKADSKLQIANRLALTAATAQVIKNGLKLLGIEVLERM